MRRVILLLAIASTSSASEQPPWWSTFPVDQLLILAYEPGTGMKGIKNSEIDAALRSRGNLAEELLDTLEQARASSDDPIPGDEGFVSRALVALFTIAPLTEGQRQQAGRMIEQAWMEWQASPDYVRWGSWQMGVLLGAPAALGQSARGDHESVFLSMLSDAKYEYGIGIGIRAVAEHPSHQRIDALEKRGQAVSESGKELLKRVINDARSRLSNPAVTVHGSGFPGWRDRREAGGDSLDPTPSSPDAPAQVSSSAIALCATGVAMAALVAVFWPRRPRK